MEWIARRARVCAWCAFPDLVRHTIYIRLNILKKNLSLALEYGYANARVYCGELGTVAANRLLAVVCLRAI